MTTHQAIKKMSAWDDIVVPAKGEVVMEHGTNKIKIGDGKTNFANLPYVDGNPPEMTLSEQAKEFIENNIEYLEVNDYETFYSRITSIALAREVSHALFKAGLNPNKYLKECPAGCKSIFYHYDPNAGLKGYLNKEKRVDKNPQHTWITTALNSSKRWDEYIIDYDIDKEVENIKNETDYLQTWMLEEYR